MACRLCRLVILIPLKDHFIKAFECFTKSVELNGQNPVVWYEMSVLAGQHGHDWGKAKQLVEKALSIDSENFPQAWKGLAMIEKHLGNDERAAELCCMLRTKYGWNPYEDPTVTNEVRQWLMEHGCI